MYKSILGKQNRSGLTLTEVLVGACIFAIAVSGISGALRQGSRLILDAENKKKAYTDAQSLLEKYLTYSYTGISALNGNNIQDAATGCSIRVLETVMTTATSGLSNIPYCTVRVVCPYDNDDKEVALSGIIPYPYMEVFTQTARVNIPSTDADTPVLSFTFNPHIRVRSDLLVFYDIALQVADNGTPIAVTDQIFTWARVLNSVSGSPFRVGAETATPILTQPSINNFLVVPAEQVSVNAANTIDIMWRITSGSNGVVTARVVNLVVIRMERNR